MPDRRNASSYDEIVRRTVPAQSGFRASIEEEHLSRHRAGKAADHVPHAQTDEERETLTRVVAMLENDPAIDLSEFDSRWMGASSSSRVTCQDRQRRLGSKTSRPTSMVSIGSTTSSRCGGER